MVLSTFENARRLRQFSIDIIETLKSNPLVLMDQDKIESSKYPDKPCQFCGQLGCDGKVQDFFVHQECLDFVTIETRKFMVNTLKLPVKK